MPMVDVHAHAGGHDPILEENFPIAGVVAAHEANGVDVPIDLFKHRHCGLTEAEVEWVLGQTAVEVYGLKGRSAAG